MSKRSASTSVRHALMFLLATALLPGCNAHLPQPSYEDIEIPQEKLRQIETLELQQAEMQEVQPPDPNEAPPAELELSLEQCRAFALQNNLQLKATLINPTIAAERLSEEEAKFEASFDLSSGYYKSDEPVESSLVIAGSQRNYQSNSVGLNVPLRTGGTLEFDLSDNRTKSDSAYSVFNPSYSNDASLSISQPLLRNAGQWANMHSIRLAAYDYQIADARTKLEVITVLAAIDRVYWRLYAARRELEVRKQQYDLGQAQLDQVRRLVDAEVRAEVEIIRAEAGVAQQLEAIIVAENNLRDRERELKRVVNKAGLDMQTPTVLVPLTEPDPARYALEGPALVRTAMDARMELLELQLQLLQDASRVDFARNQALPVAGLSYTYNINGLGRSHSRSFDLLFEGDFVNHQIGLQMMIPVGNKAAKSRIRQAMYQRRARLASRNDREAVIELEVLNAVDQVEANWQRILAARQNSILNGRLFEAEKRQFEVGLRTSTEVLDAQTNFANAQSAEISALADYQIALVDLAYATGTILGAARIQWEPIVPVTGTP